MDFFERLTGWNLDGGNGAMEWLWVAIPIIVLAAAPVIRRAARRRS